MMRIFMSVLLLTTLTPSAFAQGVKDDISIEIQTLAREAIGQLRGMGREIDQVVTQVESQIPNVRAYYTDEPLTADAAVGAQRSIALNFPKYGVILFDRERWPKVGSKVMKQAIALHEVLSLMKLENTGSYFLSSPFLASRGLTVEQLKQTLNPNVLPSNGDGSVSCDGAGDQMHFRYETWSFKFDQCKFNGYQKHPQVELDEADFKSSIARVRRVCSGNQKLLSAAAKMQTIIVTLKASAPAECVR